MSVHSQYRVTSSIVLLQGVPVCAASHRVPSGTTVSHGSSVARFWVVFQGFEVKCRFTWPWHRGSVPGKNSKGVVCW